MIFNILQIHFSKDISIQVNKASFLYFIFYNFIFLFFRCPNIWAIKSKETMFTINFFSSSRPKRRVKHSDGRQSTSSFCGNIVTADRILPPLDEELSRATEYPILQDGVLSRAREYLLRLRKHHHGRQRTSAICASIVTAEKVLSPTALNTTAADIVPDASG